MDNKEITLNQWRIQRHDPTPSMQIGRWLKKDKERKRKQMCTILMMYITELAEAHKVLLTVVIVPPPRPTTTIMKL